MKLDGKLGTMSQAPKCQTLNRKSLLKMAIEKFHSRTGAVSSTPQHSESTLGKGYRAETMTINGLPSRFLHHVIDKILDGLSVG